MKNSADLGGCYPPRPSASVDNTLLDLQNSSYPTQPHSIIAKYSTAATSISGHRQLAFPRKILIEAASCLVPQSGLFFRDFTVIANESLSRGREGDEAAAL